MADFLQLLNILSQSDFSMFFEDLIFKARKVVDAYADYVSSAPDIQCEDYDCDIF